MNLCRHSVTAFLIALFLCLCTAYGQTIAPIPAEARTATDAGPYRGEIERFVRAQVELLKDSSRPTRQSSARDALVNEMTLPGQQEPQPSFLDVYADALNSALTAEIAGHEDVRVRLLGAIVAARAAERANNTRLVPVVERLLTDDNWTVSLWAMKASRRLMPHVLRNRLMVEQNRLMGPVVEAARKHPRRGPIMHEAYGALMADLLDAGRRPEPSLIRQVVPGVQTIFAMRIDQYREGIPETPGAENRATLFLTEGRIWQAQNAEERTRTARDLIGPHILLIGQHVAAGRGERGQLVEVLQRSASAAFVLGRAIGNQPLEEAAEALLNIRGVTPADEIAALARAVHEAILAAFPNGNRQAPADARVADAPQRRE